IITSTSTTIITSSITATGRITGRMPTLEVATEPAAVIVGSTILSTAEEHPTEIVPQRINTAVRRTGILPARDKRTRIRASGLEGSSLRLITARVALVMLVQIAAAQGTAIRSETDRPPTAAVQETAALSAARVAVGAQRVAAVL